MADDFVGRTAELTLLTKRLDLVRETKTGRALAIRGRRQVGKSRLVQEFCDRAKVRYVYFTATKGMSQVESVTAFAAELRESALPADRDAIPTLDGASWPDAFRALAALLPDDPSVVILDEVPWLAEQDESFDGSLQTAWDRLLSTKSVLLLLLGSDLHMMERITAYDRPFYGRADNLVLGPLNPRETASALGLTGADAIDAHLISGGLPGILRSWPHGEPPLRFIERECADPAAPVFGVPESALLAEFPTPDQARRVLEAVGSGDRTHANIAASAGSRQGPLPSGSLSPLLRRLSEEKRVLAAEDPLSTEPGKPTLYRVADSNLRLYLGALRSAHELTRRGRADAAYRQFHRRWTAWRGRAVEPLIREALELASLAGHTPWTETEAVGGWWNRQFDPEIDLVGADRGPIARRVHFTGSIKWIGTAFDAHDLSALRSGSTKVPGYEPGTTGHVVVSLSGLAPNLDLRGIDLHWGPSDIVAAWA